MEEEQRPFEIVESNSKLNLNKVFKFCLIGDTNVGKTSLLHRYTSNTFVLTNKNTIGVDFKIITLKFQGDTYKIQIWDTAGQERFRSITTNYVKSCEAYILAYDIGNRASFESIEYWFDLTNGNCNGDSVFLLVGNKLDLEEREVTVEEGLALAQRKGMLFFETSAMSAFNVEKAFDQLILMVLKTSREKRDGTKIGSDMIERISTRKKDKCTC